jgi:hypothetical protein
MRDQEQIVPEKRRESRKERLLKQRPSGRRSASSCEKKRESVLIEKEGGGKGDELVKSGSGTVPRDLASVEGVGKGDVLRRAAVKRERSQYESGEKEERKKNALLVVKAEGDGRALSELLNTDDVNLVLRLDLLVVGGVLEVEGEHTLLLEVGPARKEPSQLRSNAKEERERGRTREYERRSG